MASSKVHRDLTSGANGEDVRRFQAVLNRRLKARHLDQYVVVVDGVVGPHTLDAAWRACYRLGSAWSTCAKIRRGRIPQSAQRIVRFPSARLPWQLAKAAWRSRHARAKNPTTMYDDVTLSLIPKDAPVVAGYTSGRFPTWPLLAKLFPKSKRISIAVNAAHDAKVLDVEPGDATPAEAPAWIKRQHARGEKHPVIYASVSAVAEVVRVCAAAGLKHGRDYLIWSAHYNHKRHLCGPQCGFGMPFQADATQYDDHALGRSLDVSILAPSFWS